MSAFVVALVGAESTGKSTLATGLAAALQARGLDAVCVDETLRRFCDEAGRTPRQDEQAGIAAAQSRRIEAAAAEHALVIADTTALLTAVYSEMVFGDPGLYVQALADHARVDLTLLTALDLPWQADGLQRDGPQVRGPVDALLRAALLRAGLGWSVVSGQGRARLDQALALVERAWSRHRRLQGAVSDGPQLAGTVAAASTAGTRDDDADLCGHGGWRHVCQRCSDGDCERRLFQLDRARRAGEA